MKISGLDSCRSILRYVHYGSQKYKNRSSCDIVVRNQHTNPYHLGYLTITVYGYSLLIPTMFLKNVDIMCRFSLFLFTKLLISRLVYSAICKENC